MTRGEPGAVSPAAAAQARIEATGISVAFGGRTLFQGVSLSVKPGCILGIVGPSGTGKTTLVKALCGLQPVASGRILLDGIALPQLGARQMPVLVWQDARLFDFLSVQDNILLGRRIRSTPDGDAPMLRDLMEKFRLTNLAGADVRHLSGGERARVALARGLAVQSDILILDEPFASLDVHARGEATDIIRAYVAGRSRAAILISHATEDILQLCDRVLVLEGVRPGAQISIQTLIARPRTGFEAQFGGYWNVVQAPVSGREGDRLTCETKWGAVEAEWADWMTGRKPDRGDTAALIFVNAAHVLPDQKPGFPARVLEADAGQGGMALVTFEGNRPIRVTSSARPAVGDTIRIAPTNPKAISARNP